MTAKIYLRSVDPDERDTILAPTVPPPFFVGNWPNENLACSSCRKVVAKHISTRILYEQFSAEHRLIIRCECEAHLQVPSQTG